MLNLSMSQNESKPKQRKGGIKSLKPNKHSRYHQGYVNPDECKKLFESAKGQPIIYRSGLELQFIRFFEQSPMIAKWASEPFCIEYYSRLDKSNKNYYPDFYIETIKGNKMIVEIKPASQTEKCDVVDTQWAKRAWIRNTDKWMAAKEFANKRGMKFVILSEKFFQ